MNKNFLASMVAMTTLAGIAHAQFPIYNALPPGSFTNYIFLGTDNTATTGVVSAMVMDDVAPTTGGMDATGFSFTTINANTVGVRVRANFFFWLADSATNAPTGVPNPGTYLLNSTPAPTGFGFTLNLNPNAANVWNTNALPANFLPVPAPGQKLWVGMFYDAVNLSAGAFPPADAAQMDNLATIMYSPTIGTSTDTVFAPTAAADTLFGVDNPAGANLDHTALLMPTGSSADLSCAIRVPGQNITGTVTLNDTVDAMALFRNVTIKLMQGNTELNSLFVTVNPNTATTSNFTVGAPASLTGPVTLVFDGSPYLKKNVTVNLSGSGADAGAVALQNGDVDNSTEVDAADIDQVITDFGQMWPGGTGLASSDVDDSGEVDAADIDIVIANFGAMDD
ncbi:MAG: hypothetical protein IT206_08675 [Fimbriimonadaceae bacterium]|nr:hypothetical protein [Fimbriimonadaceae bacterium]